MWVLVPQLHLTMRTGWAYRDYPDFDETPSRNAHIVRTGVELRKYFGAGFSAAAVAQYDRFVSRNDRFDTDRFLVGGTATWEY
jgi:hypothetical protein